MRGAIAVLGIAATALLGGPLAAAPAQAADVWPSRPIKLIVVFPAGGPSDVLARALAQKLGERVKQQVVVDNRPGGSGLIGNDIVAKAPPDGYTLGIPSAGSMAIVPNLLKLPYDRDKDLMPISVVARVPEVVVAHPKRVEGKTLAEVLAFAKANPGKLNFGSTGNGSPVHLVLERMKQLSGVDIVHVPYKGAALALQDILAGQIEMTAADAPGVIAHIGAGALRALALTDTERLPALPDVPTFAEAGLPGVEMINWYVLVGPGTLPPALLAQIHAEVLATVRDPGLKAQLGALGLTMTGTSPEEARAWIQSETKKWGDVARAANVQLD
ncbi:MAG: tripartite tricarboxylate transporter substrate binding protein [Proteobacteria bacterium]|nr:tripartite tricarboxylate transporter substrate binding protein [Pseudomonadota bacterium]